SRFQKRREGHFVDMNQGYLVIDLGHRKMRGLGGTLGFGSFIFRHSTYIPRDLVRVRMSFHYVLSILRNQRIGPEAVLLVVLHFQVVWRIYLMALSTKGYTSTFYAS